MAEPNKTSRKKTQAEKKEITKKRKQKQPYAIPLFFLFSGLLLGNIGGCYISVAAVFIIGVAAGSLVCNWWWIGRRRK